MLLSPLYRLGNWVFERYKWPSATELVNTRAQDENPDRDVSALYIICWVTASVPITNTYSLLVGKVGLLHPCLGCCLKL